MGLSGSVLVLVVLIVVILILQQGNNIRLVKQQTTRSISGKGTHREVPSVSKVSLLAVVALVLEHLAGEEVDRLGHDAFLEVLADLVVELELLVEDLELLLVNIARLEGLNRGRRGRGEEVKERVVGDNLLDDSGLVGGYGGGKRGFRR